MQILHTIPKKNSCAIWLGLANVCIHYITDSPGPDMPEIPQLYILISIIAVIIIFIILVTLLCLYKVYQKCTKQSKQFQMNYNTFKNHNHIYIRIQKGCL